jgi:putative MATE family efflux protein
MLYTRIVTMQRKKRSLHLLEENLNQLFWRLAIPSVLGMLTIGTYQLFDGIFIGQKVGPAGVAALALITPLTLINNGLAAMLGVGASSILAREIGKGNEAIGSKIFGNVLLLSALISFVVSAIGYTLAPEIITFLGGSGEQLVQGVRYFRIVIIGTFFISFAYSTNMLVRAEGKMMQAMGIMAVGSILNIILDAVFILVFEMGVFGAGLATIISQFITAVVGVFYFIHGSSAIRIHFADFRLNNHISLPILHIGFSSLAIPALTLVQMIFVLRTIDQIGNPDDLTIIGAVLKIMNFVFIPLYGIAQAYQPLAGTNFGAHLYKRVIQGFWLFTSRATIIALLFWGMLMAMPRRLLFLFIPDPVIVEAGVSAVRLYFSIFFLSGFMIVAVIHFQSLGQSFRASFLVIAKMLIFFIPLIYILPRYFGINGVWISIPAADFCVIIIGLLYIFSDFRKLHNRKELIQELI